ncbi:MAG: response regulator transcription factor [Pelovirga sp.]
MSTRILLADDHQMLREGLRSLLVKEAGLEVVAEAANGRDAVSLALKLVPEIVIIDISMPDLNGIEAARQIIAKAPQVKIIALSVHADQRFVMEMLKVGASGYLLKDSAFEELNQAIRAVLANRTYLCHEISQMVVGDYIHNLKQTDNSAYSILTTREREVLQLFAEGNSTAQIAKRLHVSVKTIETHRQNIMGKLNLRSIAELTKYAIREGLTTL